jgi:hypothetical protein
VPAFWNPTAVHARAAGHDTPNNWVTLAGRGMDWMRQAVPFHRSASATTPPAAVL